MTNKKEECNSISLTDVLDSTSKYKIWVREITPQSPRLHDLVTYVIYIYELRASKPIGLIIARCDDFDAWQGYDFLTKVNINNKLHYHDENKALSNKFGDLKQLLNTIIEKWNLVKGNKFDFVT